MNKGTHQNQLINTWLGIYGSFFCLFFYSYFCITYYLHIRSGTHIAKCLLSDDIYDYYNVSQGKITIPSMDDGEESALTDVSERFFHQRISSATPLLLCHCVPSRSPHHPPLHSVLGFRNEPPNEKNLSSISFLLSSVVQSVTHLGRIGHKQPRARCTAEESIPPPPVDPPIKAQKSIGNGLGPTLFFDIFDW